MSKFLKILGLFLFLGFGFSTNGISQESIDDSGSKGPKSVLCLTSPKIKFVVKLDEIQVALEVKAGTKIKCKASFDDWCSPGSCG
jgi:hypothetical protein